MRKSHKLLAVVMWIGSAQAQADTPRTMANGSPAAGNTMAKGRPKPAFVEKGPEAVLAAEKVMYEQAKQRELAAVEELISTPRRLPNGAPACGNTMGKSEPEPCTQALADREHAARLAEMKEAIKQRRIAKARLHEAERKAAEARRANAPDVVAMADVGARR